MRARFGAACLLFCPGATPALAHSPVPGIEGFYLGMLHPFSTPSQAVLILSLGLLIGGFRPSQARWPLAVFLGASLIALILALGIAPLEIGLFSVAVAAGTMAAILPGKILPLTIALTALGGFLIGEASFPSDGPLSDRLFTMSGSLVGASVGLLYLAGACFLIRERFPRGWVGIAFRIAGAWLVAISLVMLALDVAQPIEPV